MDLGVRIRRGPKEDMCRFTDIFHGFDRVAPIRDLFGSQSRRILATTRVRLIDSDGYLRVDNDTGDIIISRPYLATADRRQFYLDLVHELVHVRQHQEGRELYDRSYAYVDRPTEVEAYQVTVREARRIGMKDGQIAEYLKVEWVGEEDFRRMLRTLDVNP